MRRMDWAACSPLPRVPGDSQSEKSTTGEKVITDVLSNDVLCKVFTHVTRDELCAGLPLTCQAFRSALRSSGELQRSLEHSWDPANCPKRAVRAGMCCPCARLVQPCHSRHSCEGSPCCEACTHACEGAMLCCARSFTLARAWSEAACTSALRSPHDTLRGANDGGSRRGSRGGSRPAARCAGAPRDGGAPARGNKKKMRRRRPVPARGRAVDRPGARRAAGQRGRRARRAAPGRPAAVAGAARARRARAAPAAGRRPRGPRVPRAGRGGRGERDRGVPRRRAGVPGARGQVRAAPGRAPRLQQQHCSPCEPRSRPRRSAGNSSIGAVHRR